MIKIVPPREHNKFLDSDTQLGVITRSTNQTEAQVAFQGETANVTMEGRENFRTKVISREESDTSGSNLTVVNMSSLQIISYKGDATRPPREARSPISTEAGVTWDAEGYNKNKTQLLSHSMSDCRSIRNIPPSTYDMFGLIELYGRKLQSA